MPDGFIGGGDLLRPDLRILVRRNGGRRPIGPCAISGNFRTDQGPSGQILFRTGLNGLCPGTVLGFGFQNLLPRDLLRGPSVRYRGKHLRSGSTRSAVGIVGYGNGIDGFGENDVGFISSGACGGGNLFCGFRNGITVGREVADIINQDRLTGNCVFVADMDRIQRDILRYLDCFTGPDVEHAGVCLVGPTHEVGTVLLLVVLPNGIRSLRYGFHRISAAVFISDLTGR